MLERGVKLGDTDMTRVTLLSILSFNERQRESTLAELRGLHKLSQRYPELSVLGQFAYDVSQREKMTNKDLAHELHKLGFIDGQGNFTWSNFRFLEKVSQLKFNQNLTQDC